VGAEGLVGELDERGLVGGSVEHPRELRLLPPFRRRLQPHRLPLELGGQAIELLLALGGEALGFDALLLESGEAEAGARWTELRPLLGVGILTGWTCLYLFIVYVLTHGGMIQGWHAGVWVLATFLGTWLVARGQGVEDGGQISKDGNRWSVVGGRWLDATILTGVGVALPLLFSWILGHFTDFSWDGMTSRGLTVRNLMMGEEPPNAYPFGHVLGGFLAHITGNWQAGKGINLVLIWISFCLTYIFISCLSLISL
jgi:hypothetical protein